MTKKYQKKTQPKRPIPSPPQINSPEVDATLHIVDRLEYVKYNLYQLCRVQVALALLQRGTPMDKIQEETEKFLLMIDPLRQQAVEDAAREEIKKP